MTPTAFRGFQWLQETYGKDEALRAIALEHHTVSEILKIIQENEKDHDVDLVQGNHMDLLITDEEEFLMRKDFEAAKEAGIDLRDVCWHTKDENESVSIAMSRIPVTYLDRSDIPYSGWERHILASRSRDTISGLSNLSLYCSN